MIHERDNEWTKKKVFNKLQNQEEYILIASSQIQILNYSKHNINNCGYNLKITF